MLDLRDLVGADPEEVKRHLDRADGEESLYGFIKLMWHAVEPETPFVGGWVLGAICEHLEAVSSGEITRLLINVPPGCSKALWDGTPILTMWGWKCHGDLVAGDFVFGPDGQPKRVLGVTEPWDVVPLAVEFDDGSQIIAAPDHLWSIERDVMSVAPKYSRGRKEIVVATADLRTTDPQNGWRRRPDRICLASAIALPPKRLMIDPYLLGAWLGDGFATTGDICAGEEDIEHFAKLGRISSVMEPGAGRKQRFYRINVDCLATRLRMMGLRGNKHIPEDYLESSIDQRWELLRGLMDTDGCATMEGTCTFTTKLESLAAQVLQLQRSLGLKSTLRTTWTDLRGERFGPYYVVAFTPPVGAKVFNLQRKQSRVRGNQNGRSRHRYVTGVSPRDGKVSVRCIQVEGNLYLAGREFVPTHNSLCVSTFFPAWEWGPKNRGALRYMCAAYAQHLTVRDNRRFRAVITSNLYRELWGDRFGLVGESAELVSNTRTGWKLASSVGGVGTGERADRLLLDDPNRPPTDLEAGESSAVMMTTAAWFREVMPDRLNSLEKSAIIVIQQRLDERDVSGTILDLGLAYEHLMIPMAYEPLRHCVTSIGWQDPRGLGDDGELLPEIITDARGTPMVDPQSPLAEREGELAWPERFGAAALEELRKAKGSLTFAGQYQQIPVPRGGGIIKEEWWHLWAEEEFPPYGTCVAALDTAIKEREENDYSAMTVWGAFAHPETLKPSVMLRDAWRDRVNLAELVRRVIRTCRQHKVDWLLIEDATRGTDVRDEIYRLVGRREIRIALVAPRSDKVARLNATVPIFEHGIVFAPDKEWSDMVIRECSAFPRGRHDDLVDTVAMALIYLRQTGVALRREEFDEEERGRRMFKKPVRPIYDV